jgi:hypothetical protein
VVGEAAGEGLEDPRPQFDLAEQETAGVRGDVATVETSRDFATTETVKRKGRGVTLCLHEAADLRGYKLLRSQPLIAEAAASFYLVMRYAG